MGMKFDKKTSRLMDFTVTGAAAGTFPNALGRGERTREYWLAVEKDLASKRKEAQKQGGKVEKTNTRSKPMPPVTLTR
jgi:hypothetical protein